MAPRSRLIFVTLLSVGILVVGLFLASPIQATAHAMATQSAAKHCVIQLNPIRAGQTSSSIVSYTCYATFSASIAAATGGRVHLATNTSPQALSQAIRALSPSSINVIVIFFVDGNYGGNTYTATTSGSSCSTGATYGDTSMPSGWNDVVSSLEGGFYGCTWDRLWANINYGGASQCFTGNVSYVGNVMNDQTSSWYVRTTNVCGG